jgi:hypothetical protein
MKSIEKLPAGGDFGAYIVWLGRLESVIICAGYGPDPEVMAPAVLGGSAPVAEDGYSPT